MPPIFLIGYMGCGKTTLGRALAKALRMQFIDLDFYITQRFRKSINELFAEKGEAEFRRIEREMLHEAGEFADTVIACGGGTPCHFDNIDYMNSRGTTIWLQVNRDRLIERLVLGAHKRPLMAGKSREEIGVLLDTMLEERTTFYSKAVMTIDSSRLETRPQIAETVATLIPLLSETK